MPLKAARFTGEADIQAKPLSPEESLQRFKLDDGLRIELVASEPLIGDPVDISFDEQGRLFVVENNAYNRSADIRPRSRVRLLEDSDGDGRMDRGTTFAEDLDFAQGVLVVKGGIVVTTNTEILFLRDSDGDGQADVRETLFKINASKFVDHQMAAPRRGIDNWVHINNGLGGKEISQPQHPGRIVKLGAYNLRYNLTTREFEPASGRGQFGHTFDDWGHEFVTVNRNPAVFTVLPYPFMVRNAEAFIAEGSEDASPGPGEAKVYPLKTFRTTSSAHAGTYTAACGISAYRGDLLGDAYVGNLFVCEPTGELVARWRLAPSGPSFKAEHTTPGREFLATTDEWFRPVNTATGPDGALYVVDMYRRFIDGSRFFPDDYVAANDMGAGTDRGRIYRIVPKAVRTDHRLTPMPRTSAEQVALLEHRNGWRRDTAQRLLVDAGDSSVVPAVAKILAQSQFAQARLHALWTIEGLGALKPDHVRMALTDREPGVVENAVWLSARYIKSDAAIRERILALAVGENTRVRFAALLVAGDLKGAAIVKALVQSAVQDGDNNWVRAAILSSPVTHSGELLSALVKERAFSSKGTLEHIDLVNRLGLILGARASATELRSVFAALSVDTGDNWWKMAVVGGIAEGLRRQPGDVLPKSLADLVNQPPSELADSLAGVRKVLDSAGQILGDRTRPVSERLAAIPMLAHLPKNEAVALMGPMLNRLEPAQIQKALLETVVRLDRRTAAPLLYAHLNEMGGLARAGAIQYLQRNPLEFLQKVKQGAVNAALVDASGRWGAMNAASDEVRALAQEIFGRAEGDRKGLVKRYATGVAGLTGSVQKGQQTFAQTCAVCHKFRGAGNDVGPDISDVRIKSPEMLLSDILDPNSAVEPRWETYSVKTKGGGAFMGIIDSESNEAIVVKGIAGKETIARNTVESSDPLGTSLMPQGFESSLNEQNMADLLAFLRSSSAEK